MGAGASSRAASQLPEKLVELGSNGNHRDELKEVGVCGLGCATLTVT